MTAAELAKALKGRRAGRGWSARCPAHKDRTPSLSIDEAKNGRVLVHCHSGCAQEAVINALRQLGLWSGKPEPIAHDDDKEAQEREQARHYALRLWNEAEVAAGTLVETYLRSRGILLLPPLTLRYRASLWHAPSKAGWPCMVALVVDGTNQPTGIHRTFLATDGSGKAPVEPNKMMLGTCKGGVVRLAPAADGLLLGEGIETVLSAMQLLGRPGWAALSAGNLATLDLPPAIRSLAVVADDDPAGRAAALAAARRWQKQGRNVRIELPKGGDFNDALRTKTK